jgi:serine/threonine-protein kinase
MRPVGALYFAVEMGKTLAYLHGQGVVHGSLDERHVFIYPGRRAKISDPGFPVVLGGSASPHPFSHDPRRDLSDLGYLLYRSLSGRSAEEAVEDIKAGRLKWEENVPPRVRRLVQLCLDSVTGAGFPTVGDMLREAVSTLREEVPMAPEPQPGPAVMGGTAEAAGSAPAAILPLPRLKRWQLWLGASLLGVAAIFTFVWLLSIFISESKVEVPNLVNVGVEEAQKLAAARDLGVLVVGREYDSGVRAGYVISQDPKGGVMVKKKTVIKVLESLGPLTVPNLIGLTLEDARLVLESRGFRVGEIAYREVEGYSENRVVETDPPYGSRLSGGAAVNLVVNRKASGG